MAAFSLLGELEEEEEEEEEGEGEKFIPDNPGGFVAVFCPLRLFLHTGHESCCGKDKESLVSIHMSNRCSTDVRDVLIFFFLLLI